jgi:type II secretory pathway pseudopilin PulG
MKIIRKISSSFIFRNSNIWKYRMNTPLRVKHTFGFSLIELVLLVGIIAILAAIALPNFITAQTQAKVARVKKELKYIGVALEVYRVDNNSYPWLRDIGSGPNNRPDNHWTWCGLPLSLSTPIAYIAEANIWDQFPYIASTYYRSTYRYMDNNIFSYLHDNYSWNWIYSDTWVDDWAYPVYLTGSYNPSPLRRGKVWMLISVGPNCAFQDWIAYDPTNGTLSNGDIERFGP